jgi:hypothetical protein
MLTVFPPRACNPFTHPFAHLSRGRAGSKYKSVIVLWTSISETAAGNLEPEAEEKEHPCEIINIRNAQMFVVSDGPQIKMSPFEREVFVAFSATTHTMLLTPNWHRFEKEGVLQISCCIVHLRNLSSDPPGLPT